MIITLHFKKNAENSDYNIDPQELILCFYVMLQFRQEFTDKKLVSHIHTNVPKWMNLTFCDFFILLNQIILYAVLR
jgi:hypothetical protein